jgi:hypothetical protein
VGLQRLLDGKTLSKVFVEYTPSGAVVMAVPVGGEPMPLHEWRLQREVANKSAALNERWTLWSGRVHDRASAFTGEVKLPNDKFATMADSEEWLASLSRPNRKLVVMTNKEFRALSSTNSEVPSGTQEQ